VKAESSVSANPWQPEKTLLENLYNASASSWVPKLMVKSKEKSRKNKKEDTQ
jgi:hypothetical protein